MALCSRDGRKGKGAREEEVGRSKEGREGKGVLGELAL